MVSNVLLKLIIFIKAQKLYVLHFLRIISFQSLGAKRCQHSPKFVKLF